MSASFTVTFVVPPKVTAPLVLTTTALGLPAGWTVGVIALPGFENVYEIGVATNNPDVTFASGTITVTYRKKCKTVTGVFPMAVDPNDPTLIGKDISLPCAKVGSTVTLLFNTVAGVL